MRRILISLLLASAAASPAIAAPHNWAGRDQAQDDRQTTREERQSAREERQSAKEEHSQSRDESHSDRSGRSSDARQVQQQQAPQQVQQQQQQVQVQQQHQLQAQQRQQGFAGRGAERNYARPDRSNPGGRNEGNEGSAYVAPGARVVTPGPNYQQRQDARELRQSNRPTPTVMRDRHPLVVSNTPRPGTQPPLRTEVRRSPQVHWNTNWRNNNHYDWHNYRNHHRSHFHLGFYFDPYGWGYQPFSIGWRLWPSYYSSNYWINDPWSYRLPYAPPGYIWVRYWNDALLVDSWTGTVVDVLPGFFW